MARAIDEQRKLLDKLMGPDRNGPLMSKKKEFTDADICKHYLLGLCPHDLFSNTKSDLGICPLVHDENLLTSYELASKDRSYGFEREHERYIRRLIDECDERIFRLRDTIADSSELPETKEQQELTDMINQKIAEAEKLGEEGNVADAQMALEAVEVLKARKAAEQSAALKAAAHANKMMMYICDVCGAKLSALDSDTRLADHFGGRQHMGYAKLRKKLEEYVLLKEKLRQEEEKSGKDVSRRERHGEYDDREPQRYRDRERRYRDDRRDSDRDRDRDRRRKYRERSHGHSSHRRDSDSRDRY